MKKKYTAIGIALKIWLMTNLVFGIGWLLYCLVFENAGMAWTAALATFCATIGSTPVLLAMFITIPFIKESNSTTGNKTGLLFLVCFIAVIPYGIVGGNLFSFELRSFGLNNIFLSCICFTIILFSAAAIAISIYIDKIKSYFTTTKNQPTMNQDYVQTAQPDYQGQPSTSSNKTIIKAVITGAIILVMMIPTIFVTNLVSEREQRQQQVTQEISSKWAAPQTLTGPYLYLPYSTRVSDAAGKITTLHKSLFILPENLQVNGSIIPEIRPRSIYKVLLYKSDIKTSGNFVVQLPKDITPAMVSFTDTKICFGIRDFKGIQEKIIIAINGSSYEMAPGLPSKEIESIINDNSNNAQSDNDRVVATSNRELETIGLSSNIVLSAADLGKSLTFSMPVKINGSEQLHFVPLAGNSSFNLSSTWADPKFDGNNLPVSRNVSPQGFSAKWNFNKANLPFGTVIKDFNFKKEPFAFGVTMVQPADQYAKTMRSVKYAILFIGLTFALFFIIELMQQKPVHPVQYVLIGMALVIFFTLLLSISEFILFDYAYLMAAAATILLISLYAKGHFNSLKTAGVFASLLSCLYGFIFVLIRLEDTALLVGSIGLFIVLAMVMYASRKIKWYGERNEIPAVAVV